MWHCLQSGLCLELRAGLELYNLLGCDLDLLLGEGVDAFACGTLVNREGAEAEEGNGLFVLDSAGTFSVNERPAREGINPATKEKIQIAAKKVVKFKAGSQLQF